MTRPGLDDTTAGERPARLAPAADPSRLAVVASPPLAPTLWRAEAAGALVLGGDHGSLGVVRSLGRRGIPVWFLSDDKFIAKYSRFAALSAAWPGPSDPAAVAYLLDLARAHQLEGWVLFPAGDREVRLIGQNHEALARAYRLWTPPWEVTRLAADKHLMYRHAASLGIAHPTTYQPRTRHDVLTLDCRFPLILKPAEKESSNAFTQAKAWRADHRPDLLMKYDRAVELVGAHNIVLQELIPGGGDTQFSYTGVWQAGAPVASMIARRSRQYPTDFGTGTFVESVENADVEQAASTFLASLTYGGMVEIEFKYDARDGRTKIIDVNPRVWTWDSLGERAGVDFPLIQWRLAMGEAVDPQRGRAGAAWMYVPKDMLAAMHEMLAGKLTPARYLRSFRGRPTLAAYAADDPLPGLVDLPLTLARAARQWWSGK